MDNQWNENDHPRDNKGKFTDSGGTIAEHRRLEELGIEQKAKQLVLPKQEYAELCGAIRTKYADKIPQKGGILYKNDYYVYNYNKRVERIVCVGKIKIQDNEFKIQQIIERGKKWKN